MRIAYEPGLEKAAAALEEYGHELFPASLPRECDALLYKSAPLPIKAGKNGALLIYAAEKTPEQLKSIIESRTYTSLF